MGSRRLGSTSPRCPVTGRHSGVGMTGTRPLTALALLLLAEAACILPGAISPTPFVFPTPNLTLTAIFAPTGTPVLANATPTEVHAVASTTPIESEAAATPYVSISRANGRPVTASLITSPPSIDGNLDEWISDSFSAGEVTFGSQAWTGGDDASAVYRLAWDSQALYVGIQVTDDEYVQGASGAGLYRGDSAEILVDANLPGDFTSTALSADDYQVGFSAGDDPAGGVGEAYRWYPANSSGSLRSVSVASAELDSGYVLEIKIPWEVFDLSPKSGDHLGFVLSISDNDKAEESEQQSLVSSVSTRILSDPTTWGTLILGGG